MASLPTRSALVIPVLATRSQKLIGGLLVAAVCVVLYLVPAKLTLAHATTIGMPAWERAIPFLPQTVWPYLAQFPLLLLAYLGCDSLARCTRFLVAVLLVQLLAAMTFIALPLRYPREAFVIPTGTDVWTVALTHWARSIDAPVNCFPSLHVSSCLLCMALVGFDRAPRALAFGAVALASIASTLTFKQHYAIDLLAGAALASLGWWAAGRLVGAPTRWWSRPRGDAAGDWR